ncbi:MAG: UDP-glucose 4-epimerase GalE [Anderseniella sp.]
MSVLVTGGAGYIGSHMVLALCDASHDVVVLDNLSTGVSWAVAPQARLIEGDIGDEELTLDIIGEHKVDAIIHFAGSIIVPESVSDPLGYYLNNTVKSHSLIHSAVKAGVPHFIFSSTAAVYGNPATVPVSEDGDLLPISPYGTSKLITELMLRDVSLAHDLNYVALRYFNVAGADPKGRSGQSTPQATHLIKVACEVALGKRDHLQIFGRDYDTRDGTCMRDYIHVSDLVQAHVDALTYLRSGAASQVFNCGYGQGYSVLDVIGAVERAAGHKLDARDGPRRSGDPAEIIANADRARSVLEWQPQHDDLDFIAASALAWEKHLQGRNS